MVQLSVEGGHFTSAEKVGDDTRRVKYLSRGVQSFGELCVSERTLTYKITFRTLSLHRPLTIYLNSLSITYTKLNIVEIWMKIVRNFTTFAASSA